MATIFKTWLNYREESPQMELNTQESMTQPDMTLSIRELLDRYAKGLPVTLREGYYEEEDYSEFDGMDIADLHEMKDRAREHVESLTAQVEDLAKKRKEKKDNKDSVPPPEDVPEDSTP